MGPAHLGRLNLAAEKWKWRWKLGGSLVWFLLFCKARKGKLCARALIIVIGVFGLNRTIV